MQTGENPPDGYNYISIAPCGSYNGGILEKQWFYANYVDDGDLSPRVELTFEGYPGNSSRLDTYGEQVDDQRVYAQVLNTPSPMSIALFNVAIIS